MSPFHKQEARPRISCMDSPLPVQRQHRSYPCCDEHFLVTNGTFKAIGLLRLEHHGLEVGSAGMLLNEPHYPVSLFLHRRRRLHKWTILRQSNSASEQLNRAWRHAAERSSWKIPVTESYLPSLFTVMYGSKHSFGIFIGRWIQTLSWYGLT